MFSNDFSLLLWDFLWLLFGFMIKADAPGAGGVTALFFAGLIMPFILLYRNRKQLFVLKQNKGKIFVRMVLITSLEFVIGIFNCYLSGYALSSADSITILLIRGSYFVALVILTLGSII